MTIFKLTRSLLLMLLLSMSFTVHSDELQYKVQKGDILQISLPGEPEFEQPFAVDRQGRIMLPEIGALQIAALSVEEIQKLLTQKLGNAFIDLQNLKVSLLKKQLIIDVRGYVEDPGEFILESDASIQLAIHAAGGLRKGAQLDRMQLIRNNQTKIFNYKKYLDSGDSTFLPELQSMDALFIPASPMTGNVEVEFNPTGMANAGDSANNRQSIKIFGQVNHPGSFAYRDKIDIIDLLMASGGVTQYAGIEKMRVITQGAPKLFDLKKYLDSGDQKYLPEIQPGSTIFIPKQEEEIKTGAHMVYVMGEVAKPGAYESKAGASFMDILANAGGPTRYAESRQIRIIKADSSIITFDLSAYTESGKAVTLPQVSGGDAIFVPEKIDINEKSWLKVPSSRAVRVFGSVVRPGRIEWSDEMSLMDLLANVGGPTSSADTSNIEVIIPQNNGKPQVHKFDLNAFIKNGQPDSDLPEIKAGSTIMVQELPQDPNDDKARWIRQSAEKSIYIFGQVGAPGRYMFTDKMTFLDILSAADGPTEKADLRNIRINHRNKRSQPISKLDLALYFETGDDSMLPLVRTGDTIYIPATSRPWLDQSKESTVRVLGAVNKPGRYSFDDTMTLLDLLAEAGGTTSGAYIENITVVNVSCCSDQSRSFNLSDFSRNARFSDLPVLRAGDTVYIPFSSESYYEKFSDILTTIVQAAALAVAIGIL